MKRTCEIQDHPFDPTQVKIVVDGCPLLYITREHAEEFKKRFDFVYGGE